MIFISQASTNSEYLCNNGNYAHIKLHLHFDRNQNGIELEFLNLVHFRKDLFQILDKSVPLKPCLLKLGIRFFN